MKRLRRNVLKQAIATLAKFIGSIHYSNYLNHVNVRTTVGANEIIHDADAQENNGNSNDEQPNGVLRNDAATILYEEQPDMGKVENPIFDDEALQQTLHQANHLSSEFGVQIIGISIISAHPSDPNLMTSLAATAVTKTDLIQAKAQSRVMQIEAHASATVRKINAESEATANLIRAKADAEAEILRADGSKEASMILETSPLAMNLQTIKASAGAIQNSDKFFFGQQPDYTPKMVMSQQYQEDIHERKSDLA